MSSWQSSTRSWKVKPKTWSATWNHFPTNCGFTKSSKMKWEDEGVVARFRLFANVTNFWKFVLFYWICKQCKSYWFLCYFFKGKNTAEPTLTSISRIPNDFEWLILRIWSQFMTWLWFMGKMLLEFCFSSVEMTVYVNHL